MNVVVVVAFVIIEVDDADIVNVYSDFLIVIVVAVIEEPVNDSVVVVNVSTVGSCVLLLLM